MRKRKAGILAVVLLLILATSVSAAMTETSVTRSLTFSGTTANCSATIKDNGKTISATMELWCGSVPMAVWSDSGTSRVDLDGSLNVVTGMTYTLKVYGTINGVSFEAAPLVRSN